MSFKKILFHREIKGDLNSAFKFPHSCLHEDIQDYIEDNNVKQDMYFVTYTHSNLLIHLHNGDRIDVWL